MVAPLVIASALTAAGKLGGDGIGAFAKAYGTAKMAEAQVNVAKAQADAAKGVARYQGEAQRASKSIDESSEVMGILDRPCIRIQGEIAEGVRCELDLSLLSLHGLLAFWDIAGQYHNLVQAGPNRWSDAQQNNDIIQGLLGYAPIDPASAAMKAQAFKESNPSLTVPSAMESPITVREYANEGFWQWLFS